MDGRFETSEINNILRILSDEDALYVLGLSLAANDLASNLEALKRFPDSENMYFFVTSLSIVRELAKLLVKMDGAQFLEQLSDNSNDLLGEIKKELVPFEEGSLVKSILKPLRDITFHYNYNSSTPSERSIIDTALFKLKTKDAIEVGFVKDGTSALEQRYIYADTFRTDMIKQLLNEGLVSKITVLTVNIVAFVDSLLANLKEGDDI